MTQQELLKLVKLVQFRQAEMQTVEGKVAHLGCPKRLYDTLSSFSNQDKGGILLFGLDEMQSFRAVGVYDLQDLQKQVTEQCNQMEPPVRAVFTIAEYEAVSVCQSLSLKIVGMSLLLRCTMKGQRQRRLSRRTRMRMIRISCVFVKALEVVKRLKTFSALKHGHM